MAEKLEACPFCGAEVSINPTQCAGEYPFIRHAPKIGGNQCGMEGFSSFNVGGEDEATLIRLWNTRATPDRSDDALAEETFASIVAWGGETFGIAADPDRIVERAWEEWREMIAEKPGTPERAIEAADVIIVLLRTPGILDAIRTKMAKNRARQWRLLGDGTGYHVPAALKGNGL